MRREAAGPDVIDHLNELVQQWLDFGLYINAAIEQATITLQFYRVEEFESGTLYSNSRGQFVFAWYVGEYDHDKESVIHFDDQVN